MRVVYDYQIFSVLPFGGISRYFIELAQRLSELDECDAKILAPLYINKFVHQLEKGIVTGYYMPAISRIHRVRAAFNRGLSNLWLARNSVDILHETFFLDKPIQDTNKGTKRVITVYDMIDEKFPECFSGVNYEQHIQKKKDGINRADHVICISEKTKEDMIEIVKVDPVKVSVVHLGFTLTNGDASSGIPLISKPYLLYVGMRYQYKNFRRLLKAYASSRTLNQNWKLVCFGGGALTREEYAFARQLGISDDQLLWMDGKDSTLSNLYQYAAALVYPSLYEGFGLPPLEAMSHDCPVICSNGGSLPEVVSDAGTFFDPYSVEAIADAIESVVANTERSKQLQLLGEERITHFSWEDCASQTLEIYQSLL